MVGAFGEPDAGKLARPVRRGAIGNVLCKQVSNAPVVYPTQRVAGSTPAWRAVFSESRLFSSGGSLFLLLLVKLIFPDFKAVRY